MVQLRGVAGNYLICRLEGTELLSSRTKLSPEESQARPEFRVNKIRKRFETNEQAPFEEAFDDVVPVPYGSGFAARKSWFAPSASLFRSTAPARFDIRIAVGSASRRCGAFFTADIFSMVIVAELRASLLERLLRVSTQLISNLYRKQRNV